MWAQMQRHKQNFKVLVSFKPHRAEVRFMLASGKRQCSNLFEPRTLGIEAVPPTTVLLAQLEAEIMFSNLSNLGISGFSLKSQQNSRKSFEKNITIQLLREVYYGQEHNNGFNYPV